MIARYLETIHIAPATIASNTVECFAIRKGSFISCPIDRVINCMLHLSKSTKDVLGVVDKDMNTCYKYLGKKII